MTEPYHVTVGSAYDIVTDYDVFPYNRWFRGIAQSEVPIVAEREAGYRPLHNSCYRVQVNPADIDTKYPSHFFQAACSTVTPCYPEYLTKHANNAALNLMLNRSCITEYR